MKKLFISQSMRGKTDEKICEERTRAMKHAAGRWVLFLFHRKAGNVTLEYETNLRSVYFHST